MNPMTIRDILTSAEFEKNVCGNAENFFDQNTAQEKLREIIKMLRKGAYVDEEYEAKKKEIDARPD